MKILFNQNIYNPSNNFTNKYSNYEGGISFGVNPIKYVNDLFSKNDNFSPKYSIIEDKDGYIGDVGTHLSKLPKNKRAAEARRLYSYLDSPQEKSAFKKYFGEYILTEQPKQSSNNSLKTQHQTRQNDKSSNLHTSPYNTPQQRSTQGTKNNTSNEQRSNYTNRRQSSQNINLRPGVQSNSEEEENKKLIDEFKKVKKALKEADKYSDEIHELYRKKAELYKQINEKKLSTVSSCTSKEYSDLDKYQQSASSASNPNKIRTKEELIAQIDSAEEKDISPFVTRIAKGTRDEQYNLVDAYRTLKKKYDELFENDPSTKYKQKLSIEYFQQLKADIEQEFKQEGRKYSYTDVLIEDNKRLEQMAVDAGYGHISPETEKLGCKVRVLGYEMKEQNISFVPKPNFTCGSENPEQYEKEKFDYTMRAINSMYATEASAMDALEIFDKYGKRTRYGYKNCKCNLDILTIKTTSAFEESDKTIDANKLLDKYLDVFSKYASKDKADKDVANLNHIVRNCLNNMTKDMIIKLIDVLKSFPFQNDAAWNLSYRIKSSPEMLEFVKEDDLPEIKEHLKELEIITEKNSN